MNKADRLMAVLFAALGLAMLIGGFQMDRLEIRQIHPASIPGLVPMILGGLLVLCALLLFASAQEKITASRIEDAEREAKEQTGSKASWTNLFVCMIWSTIFATLLVGNLPFVWASGIYIALFFILFGSDISFSSMSTTERATLIAKALFLGAVAAIAISSLFRYGFLVRLP